MNNCTTEEKINDLLNTMNQCSLDTVIKCYDFSWDKEESKKSNLDKLANYIDSSWNSDYANESRKELAEYLDNVKKHGEQEDSSFEKLLKDAGRLFVKQDDYPMNGLGIFNSVYWRTGRGDATQHYSILKRDDMYQLYFSFAQQEDKMYFEASNYEKLRRRFKARFMDMGIADKFPTKKQVLDILG